MRNKPKGWLPTKPSPQMMHMLRMFSKGWRFKLHNNVKGSWNTYWALRRRDLVSGASTGNELTQRGRDVLAYFDAR